MTYTSPKGHALVDRALYLPKSWTKDPSRCAEAGVPVDIEFATKPALAAAMINNALVADVPASWVAGEEVYDADPDLRTMSQDREIGYVLAISCGRRIPTEVGDLRVDELAGVLPPSAWQPLSAGAKGPRMYSRVWIATIEMPQTGSCSGLN